LRGRTPFGRQRNFSNRSRICIRTGIVPPFAEAIRTRYNACFRLSFSLLQVIQVLESDDNDDPRANESLEQERRKDLVVAFLPWLRSSEQFD
jgi:hypothetical protein